MAYTKNGLLVGKEVPDGLLLFDPDSGRMFHLNPTAGLLWQKSKDSFEPDDLVGIVRENCLAGNDCESDIREFIKSAVKHNLVSENGKTQVRKA